MPEPRFPTGSAATVGAQQGFTLLRTIVGIPPGGHGTVACVTPGGTRRFGRALGRPQARRRSATAM